MKTLITILLLITSLYSYEFTKNNIVGEWRIEGYKENSTVQFGTYTSKRNETLTLLFNKVGKVKVLETNDIYFYEITHGDLKIYQQKTYKYGNVRKLKNRYNLMTLTSKKEGCYIMKTTALKLHNSYKTKHGVKICKINNIPTPVTYTQESYKF